MASSLLISSTYYSTNTTHCCSCSLLNSYWPEPHLQPQIRRPNRQQLRQPSQYHPVPIRIHASSSTKPPEFSDGSNNNNNSPSSWLWSLLSKSKYFNDNGEVKKGVGGGIVAAFLIFMNVSLPLLANAVLYSPDTKVPRTGELALRKAIPANASMKAVQESLEDISYLLRIPQRKPYATMEGDVKKALKIATEQKESILSNVPAEFKEKGSSLYSSLIDGQVLDGAYDGVKINCTDQAVLVDSKLENSGYSVPLEVMPSGQFEPLYKTALSIQDGELPVLPLSVYGAVAMQHSADSQEYSSPSQFFFYLYDKSYAGLGGLSFDEGQFSVFGYTTAGREVLSQIKSGDIIRSAKFIEGRDRLILPPAES